MMKLLALLMLLSACASTRPGLMLVLPDGMRPVDGGAYVCFYRNAGMFCAPLVNTEIRPTDPEPPAPLKVDLRMKTKR